MNTCLLRVSAPVLKASGLAIAAVAMMLSGAPGHAEQVTIKRVSTTPSPSPAALARTKPLGLPQLTQAQMKARGLLTEDGKMAQPPKQSGMRSGPPRIISRGNPGGPAMPVMEVFPERYLPTSASNEGKSSPTIVGSDDTVAPMNFGESEWPFSTARVELTGKHVTSKVYPYRAVGKLFILNADGTPAGHCSASLIAKGILVTAAHCVADNTTGTFYDNWVFYPGFYNGKSVGKSNVRGAVIPTSYLLGDSCLDGGVVCTNDIAVVVLASSRGKFIGSKTGWLGVATDFWGFNSSYETHITQLGYPGGLDYGNQMIRNDSEGVSWDVSEAYNTIIGSQMNGGSSGGPWVTNFGIAPVANGVGTGYDPYTNMVVGVSSWGYPSAPVFRMGASPFLSTTINDLYATACSIDPLACAP